MNHLACLVFLAAVANSGVVGATQPAPPLIELVLSQPLDDQEKASGLFIHQGCVCAKKAVILPAISEMQPVVRAIQQGKLLQVKTERITDEDTNDQRLVLHLVGSREGKADLRIQYSVAGIKRWDRKAIVPLDSHQVLEEVEVLNSTVLPWGTSGQPFRLTLAHSGVTQGELKTIWQGSIDPLLSKEKRSIVMPTSVNVDANTLWVDLDTPKPTEFKRYVRLTNTGRVFPAADDAIVVGLPTVLPSAVPATLNIPEVGAGLGASAPCSCDAECTSFGNVRTIALGNALETAVAISIHATAESTLADYLPIELDPAGPRILLIKTRRFHLCLTNSDTAPRRFSPFTSEAGAHAFASQTILPFGSSAITAWSTKYEIETVDFSSDPLKLETIESWIESLASFQSTDSAESIQMLLQRSRAYREAACKDAGTSAEEYVKTLLEALQTLRDEIEEQAAVFKQHDQARRELERLVAAERQYLALEHPEMFYYEIIALRNQIEKQREYVRQLRLDRDLLVIATTRREGAKLPANGSMP